MSAAASIFGIVTLSILAGGFSERQAPESGPERRYGWTEERAVRGSKVTKAGADKFVLRENLLPDSSPGSGNGVLFRRDRKSGDMKPFEDGIEGAFQREDGKLFYVRKSALYVVEDGERGISVKLADRSTGDFVFDKKTPRIAMVRLGDEDDPTVIDLMDTEGKALRTLVKTDGSAVWLPIFTPDGKSIIFLSAESGYASFWRVEADGSSRRQLTNASISAATGGVTSQDFVPPAESRDKMAFISNEILEYQTPDGSVWHLNVDSGSARKVKSSEGRTMP